MVTESIVPLLKSYWPQLLGVGLVVYVLHQRYQKGLNKYPGPLIASFTNWWRFWDVYKRRPDITHLRLHRELGDIVRLGPNTLSFADPKALKSIYGLNKGMVKVRRYKTITRISTNETTKSSRTSISFNKRSLLEYDFHLCSQRYQNHFMLLFDDA